MCEENIAVGLGQDSIVFTILLLRTDGVKLVPNPRLTPHAKHEVVGHMMGRARKNPALCDALRTATKIGLSIIISHGGDKLSIQGDDTLIVPSYGPDEDIIAFILGMHHCRITVD